MKKIEELLALPQEERIRYYLKNAAAPEGERDWRIEEAEDLNLTEEQVLEFRMELAKSVSMLPTKKRDKVVKEVAKPLLKAEGFRTKGNDWWKEFEDFYLLVHLKNSMWNSSFLGVRFSFLYSACKKENLHGEVHKQWINNQSNSIEQQLFLPYAGFLEPFSDFRDYEIGGMSNYLPKDEPVEEIIQQIRKDFESYVLPRIRQVHTYEDMENLVRERKDFINSKEIRILRYLGMACDIVGGMNYEKELKAFGLTGADLREHLDWVDILDEKSGFPNRNSREKILSIISRVENI